MLVLSLFYDNTICSAYVSLYTHRYSVVKDFPVTDDENVRDLLDETEDFLTARIARKEEQKLTDDARAELERKSNFKY